MEKDKKPVTELREAFYLIPKNGGFQIRKVVLEEDVVLSDDPFSDPDGWEQVISVVEQELSRKFQ